MAIEVGLIKDMLKDNTIVLLHTSQITGEMKLFEILKDYGC